MLASDAAARLLADQHDAFGDWGLAIAAYNLGAAAVRDAIEDGGTRWDGFVPPREPQTFRVTLRIPEGNDSASATVSLSLADKTRILDSVGKLSSAQLQELIRIFAEERRKALADFDREFLK